MISGPHAKSLYTNLRGGTRGSIYLIVSEGEGCLIDTGLGETMREEICHLVALSRCQLKYIILTHDHFDHVANATEIAKRFEAPILAHSLDCPLIEDPLLLFAPQRMKRWYGRSLEEAAQEMNHSVQEWRGYRELIRKFLYFPQRIDQTVEEGMTLAVGDCTLEILHTPGHSPGSISLYNPASQSLYVADLPLQLCLGRPFPIGNARSLLSSLEKVLRLPARFLGKGHYQGIRGPKKIQTLLQERLTAVSVREEKIIELLGQSSYTIGDLATQLFPRAIRYPFYPTYDSVIHCHLLKLLQEGRVKKQKVSGRIVWSLH